MNGQVILAYAQPGDINPWHGWLFAYDATTLAQTSVYCTTPNGAAGGIWMGGGAPAADSNGFIYANTGNGDYNAGSNNYADSYVKFSLTNGIQQMDYFTPNNQSKLQAQDLDVSSAGLLLLPDSIGSASHPHLLLGGSKFGVIFLLDCDQSGPVPGGERQSNRAGSHECAGRQSQIFSAPAYWNGLFYIAGTGDHLKSFSISNAYINPSPVGSGVNATTFSLGATPTISANGNSNAIVWIINNDGFYSGTAASLHAFNATNLSQELYNSGLPRDALGASTRFTTPAVANGKVYVPSRYKLSVFGNATFLQAPVISPNGGVFTNSQTVTLTNSFGGAIMYYTLDGTAPTTNSLLYSGPFVINQSTLVRAVATYPGSPYSATASASFINSLILPPAPWQASDIGSVAFPGSTYFSNGVFVVSASGADIYGTSDAFRFVYQTSAGDCTNIARVTSVQNINVYSKAGIMIRDNLSASAPNAVIEMTAAEGASFQYRSTSGGSTTPNFAAGLNAPYWVKMVRIGNTFTGYRSPDGVTWTQREPVTSPWPPPLMLVWR